MKINSQFLHSLILNFFRRVRLSCTSASSYKALKAQSFWHGYWYLFFVLVITTFVSMVVFAAQAAIFMPRLKDWIADAQQTVPGLYPAELVLTFSGAELSTSVEEPYVFPLPPAWEEAIVKEADGNDESDDIRHLLVIDTEATAEEFPQYQTAVLLTRTAVIARDSNAIKVIFYSEFQKPGAPPIVINRELYDELARNALPFLELVPMIVTTFVLFGVLLLPWLGAQFLLLGYLLYLLFFTLVAWLIAAIMSRKFTYGELYKLGLYGLTPAILIEWVLHWFHRGIPMLFSLIFLVTMGIVINAFPKKGVKAIAVSSASKARKKK